MYGNTPLAAAIKHNHPSIVTTLLLYGADPNVPASDGTRMPLMMACEIGNKEIVQSLLQRNANIDQHERIGNTPLIIATRQGHSEIVQLNHLIAHWMDIVTLQVVTFLT